MKTLSENLPGLGCLAVGAMLALLPFFPVLVIPLAIALLLMALSGGSATNESNNAHESTAKPHLKPKVQELEPLSELPIEKVKDWHTYAESACRKALKNRGWITRGLSKSLEIRKPAKRWLGHGAAKIKSFALDLPSVEKTAILAWLLPVEVLSAQKNASHGERALEEFATFFDNVESSPLTREQCEAVLCFDDRVRVIASAGSGKTSTLVAKVVYAVIRGYFKPSEILVLAFNRDAAEELNERIRKRLPGQENPKGAIAAQTFHAFGLGLIGKATGKKPSLAPWVDSGRELEELQDIVNELKLESPEFAEKWDLFRLVFAQDLADPDKDEEFYDTWDSESGRGGYWTLNGEIVKSQGERIIADWLFIYGVPYEYERPYEFETATSEYQQYKPDFYFPEIYAYLEHWAVDQNGEVIKAFRGYEDSMRWKRQTHQSRGTTLLETSYGDLLEGTLSRKLRAQLLAQGQQLDYDPERVGNGREPISDRRLLFTMRTFMSHVKGNQLSMVALRERMDKGLGGRSRERQVLFLDLFEPVWAAWERRLKASKGIDFDDMLSAAADLMERKAWKSPYRLILVDEFQDTSQARGRLIKQLAKKRNSCLFTVGDDWQSINRFAGSDLSLMTDFSSNFGDETTLALGTTFRCPQALCDISSEFIQKNPSQIQKQVTSASALRPRKPVSIRRVGSEAEVQSMVKTRVDQIVKAVKAPMTILILGRYNQDRRFVPRLPKVSGVKVEFRTVHGAKGLQADHVILPNLTAGTYGFPSQIEDDPVIQLAMPGGDRFPNAEERRLFYVALTRAKSSVSIMTVAGRESEFLVELIQDHGLQMRSDDGTVTRELTCPKCKKGVLVEKTGKYGKFWSCSRFPSCRYARSHDD